MLVLFWHYPEDVNSGATNERSVAKMVDFSTWYCPEVEISTGDC